MSDDEQPDVSENPEKIIDAITEAYDQIQKDLLQGASLVGQEKERYESIRPILRGLASRTTDDPDTADAYRKNINALASFRNELEDLKPRITGLASEIATVVRISDSTASTAGGTAAVFNFGSAEILTQSTLPNESRFMETKARLAILDESLADTYRSIWEVLYGTRSNPERGALYLTRQVYDHFFSLLAPDRDVRASAYWTRKEGVKPQLVTRAERLKFAANTHVQDEMRRTTLLSSASHMLSVYQALNRAHAREDLEEARARSALREMFKLIEAWVWAIDIPLSYDSSSP